jgi:hypothetical protein
MLSLSLHLIRPVYSTFFIIFGCVLLLQDIQGAYAEDIPLRILFTNNVHGEVESCG